MPPDSNWNMPLVSPRQNRSSTFSSVGNRLVRCRSGSLALASRDSTASRMTRQRAQAEEVHLQQAALFGDRAFELREDVVVRCLL